MARIRHDVMRIRGCGPLARMAGSSCSCRRAAGHRHALRVCRAGIVEPACVDHDLAILLTKVRQHDVALCGPRAAAWFDAVPASDFTVAQWDAEPDWRGDECNVVLAIARIRYSAATGGIAPKDVAAT